APDPRLVDFAALVAAMRSGARGSMRIGEAEAAALGLAGDVVAAYEPVAFRGGHWSVALLSSTEPLRAHERALVVRLSIAGAAIGLCLVASAVYAVLATRRSIALRERLRLEESLLRAEKLATVGVLASGIAHEIGTPLGVVRGRSEYILGKLGEDSPHRGGMRVIIDEIDRVSRTIRQLLDFAR